MRLSNAGILFEKQMEIFQRMREWRVENEQLGLR
jgi:hypothetical protein